MYEEKSNYGQGQIASAQGYQDRTMPKRDLEIPNELMYLSQSIEDMYAALSELGQRLQPIGNMREEKPGVMTPTRQIPQSPLARDLFDKSARISDLAKRVRLTLDELEI